MAIRWLRYVARYRLAIQISGAVAGFMAVATTTVWVEAAIDADDSTSFDQRLVALVLSGVGVVLVLAAMGLRHISDTAFGTLYYVRFLPYAAADWHFDALARAAGKHYADKKVIVGHVRAPLSASGVRDVSVEVGAMLDQLRQAMNEDTQQTGFLFAPNMLWPVSVYTGWSLLSWDPILVLEGDGSAAAAADELLQFEVPALPTPREAERSRDTTADSRAVQTVTTQQWDPPAPVDRRDGALVVVHLTPAAPRDFSAEGTTVLRVGVATSDGRGVREVEVVASASPSEARKPRATAPARAVALQAVDEIVMALLTATVTCRGDIRVRMQVPKTVAFAVGMRMRMWQSGYDTAKVLHRQTTGLVDQDLRDKVARGDSRFESADLIPKAEWARHWERSLGTIWERLSLEVYDPEKSRFEQWRVLRPADQII